MTTNIFLGWPEKLFLALLTIAFFVAGFFASLLALAAGSALVVLSTLRLWWRQRKQRKRLLTAEYRVLDD